MKAADVLAFVASAAGGVQDAGWRRSGAGGFWARSRDRQSTRPAAMTASRKYCAPMVRIPMSCLALPEEHRAEIGSVDLRVAHGARLILGGLVVGRPLGCSRCSVHVRRMATQTQEIDVVHLQAAADWSSHAACGTTCSLRRSSPERARKRTGPMVSVWHLVQTANWPAAARTWCPVCVPCGLWQSLHWTSPTSTRWRIGPRELGLLRGMAAEAQLGLRLHQHEIHVGGFVRTVTRSAADAVGQVRGLGEILRLQARLVTLGTDGCCLRRAQRLEANDLGDIAAAVDVRLRRAMTGLASVLVALEQRCVRSVGEVLVPDFLVAGLADVGLGVLAARSSRARTAAA